MSPDLPFDIIALVIDIVGASKDTDLLRELALVSHSFLHICSKHLFATVELHDLDRNYRVASSKKGFIKLLKSRPEVVRYIRKLTYRVSPAPIFQDNDHLLSSILLHLLPSFSCLNCLAISASVLNWNTLDTSLTSALLRLMHLPTINHIDLAYIENFPLFSLTLSVNLHLLDIFHLTLHNPLKEDFPEIVVMMPKIREFHTSGSSQLTTKLLHAKMQDGQSAFNFMDIRRLSIRMSYNRFEDEGNIRYLLQNAELLEELHLSVGHGSNLEGLLSPSPRTLKVLDLSVSLYHKENFIFLGGICKELEALAGHNLLETLFLKVAVFVLVTEDFIGSIFQEVEKILVKPEWPMLRQVSFKVSISSVEGSREWSEMIQQSIPEKYLSHLSKLESIGFDFSVGPHVL